MGKNKALRLIKVFGFSIILFFVLFAVVAFIASMFGGPFPQGF